MQAILTVWGEPDHKSFILSFPRHIDVPEAPTQEELAPIFGSGVDRETFDWLYKGQIRVSNQTKEGRDMCLIFPLAGSGRGQMSKFDEFVGPGFRERRLALGGRLTIAEFQLSETFVLSDVEFEQILARLEGAKQGSVTRFSNGLHVIDFDITSRTVTQVRW